MMYASRQSRQREREVDDDGIRRGEGGGRFQGR